jgi:excisionase family DNA binding protein
VTLLTLREAAAELRVSVRTLEREHADGKLAIVKIRSLRMVAREELDRYIAAQCQSGKSGTAGKSVSGSVADAVLSELSRQLLKERTPSSSKPTSGRRRSTLWLAASRDT